MSTHTKLIRRSAAGFLAIATVAGIGTAANVYASGDTQPSAPPSELVVETSNPSTGGGPVAPACDQLPSSWVVRDWVFTGDVGNPVNPWAAGDAAAARYFNELARLCAGS